MQDALYIYEHIYIVYVQYNIHMFLYYYTLHE